MKGQDQYDLILALNYLTKLSKDRIIKFQRALEYIRRVNLNEYSIITFWSEKYPYSLRKIRDPPLALIIKGIFPKVCCIGIVGSRRPRPENYELAYKLAGALAERGYCIVSGLALGIDTAAHKGALDFSGETIAVLPWLEPITPRSNRELACKIVKHGCLLSEILVKPEVADFGSKYIKSLFIRRNRITSGLSTILIAVDIAEDGGTLNTIETAVKQGKDVLVVKSGIYSNKMLEKVLELNIKIVEPSIEAIIKFIERKTKLEKLFP